MTTAAAQPVMTLPTVVLPPKWRDPVVVLGAGIVWMLGCLLTTAVVWAPHASASGQSAKGTDAPGWIWWLPSLSFAGFIFALVMAAVLTVLNPLTPGLPQWGTPHAQKIPAKRWGLPFDYAKSAPTEIESCYDVTVIRAERQNRWVVQDRDGTVRIGTLVMLGTPGPNGQKAVLTYEGLPAAA